MLNLFKRQTNRLVGKLWEKKIDYHSHILPGVDDGVTTIESSLNILNELEDCGYKQLWLTPHIMEDFPNETDYLKAKFEELKSHYKGNIQLHLAAEYMLDNLFEERLLKNDFLLHDDNRILIETSYFNPPTNFYRILEKVHSKGYHIILAHPERYLYMDMKDYQRLKDMNIDFQLNMFSVEGVYGNTAKKKAKELLKKGMYEYIGSDLHRTRQLGLVKKQLLGDM